MESVPGNFSKALLTRIEASGIRYARALHARNEHELAFEPAGKLRLRRIGFDSSFLRAHFCQPPTRQIPARRVKKLSMRSKYADGGPTLARRFDEGDVW